MVKYFEGGSMRKIILFFVMIFIISLSGCKQDDQIIIADQNVNLYIGETYEINYHFSSNKKYDKNDIAIKTNSNNIIIDGNTVYAISLGKAEIKISLKKNKEISQSLFVNVIDSLELINNNDNTIYVGQKLELQAIDKSDKEGLGIEWKTSNILLATVRNGIVTAYKEGTVTITATSKTNNVSKSITLTIIEVEPEDIVIENNISQLYVNEQVKLKANVLPEYALQNVTWEVDNPLIASIDQYGNLKGLKSGEVTVIVSSKKKPEITTSFAVEVVSDPIKIIEGLHVQEPFKKLVTTYGYNPNERTQWVYSSVSLYFNDDLNLVEQIVPINQNQYQGMKATPEILVAAEGLKLVRSGILHETTKYITYHDTGNHTPGANAMMHAQYMVSSYNINDRARSWHYTVDDKSVYHHIPDNEVAWQGDTYEAYAKSIGVETCVDYGSDLYATWQRTAKLMANLMVKHNLTIKDIKQHYDFNGKNCPQTLRRNYLYQHALELVQAEYQVLTELKDYTITFKSLNKEYVDDRGRIIKLPQVKTQVGYEVHITNHNEYDQKITLYSTLPSVND